MYLSLQMFVPIVLAVIALACTPCQGDDAIIRQNRPLSTSSFDEIIIDGSFDVSLTQSNGNASIVDIETMTSIQSSIIVEILQGHILFVHIKTPIVLQRNINAYIQFSTPLRRYTIKGIGNTITVAPGLTNTGADKFILDNSGTANVAMQLNVNELEVTLSGTGNSRFWGQAREQVIIDSKGVGEVNTLDLLTKKAKVHSTGVSTVRVAATDDVEIEVTGVSSVYYRLPAGKKPSKETSTGLARIIPIA